MFIYMKHFSFFKTGKHCLKKELKENLRQGFQAMILEIAEGFENYFVDSSLELLTTNMFCYSIKATHAAFQIFCHVEAK